MYNNIFEPIRIRNLEIKNRIVFAPTSFGYDKENTLNKLINIAKGGAGLIIIGDVSVIDSFHKEMPTLSRNEHIQYFKRVVNEVHKYGCKISAQLFCPEYDVDYIKELILSNKMNRDQLRKALKENSINYINNMSREKINKIQDDFVKASERAKIAGFDMIQIHGDRLLGSFSSSLFNKRTDEYGGSKENRVRISAEIVEKIKKQFTDIIIDYKLGIRKEKFNLGKGGATLDEVETFVTLLDKSGVDSFHVTIANHSSITDTIPADNHIYLKGEGCFLDLAYEVRKYTNKIVCALGKFKTPEFIDKVLENKEVDMIGLSRQFIADDQWPLKVLQGREKDILYCKFCNVKCTNALMNNSEFGCVLHKSLK